MVGFGLSNLVVPENPVSFDLNMGSLTWNISPLGDYSQRVQKLKSKPVYMATFEISNDDSDIRNQEFFHDLRNVCLCFSYLSGSAVTLLDSGFRSVCQLLQTGDGFPRERPLSTTPFFSESFADFQSHIATMMANFNLVCQQDHVDIIIHHWLDAMYSWSLEDFYLSGCTILELIKWNERRKQNKPKLYLLDALESTHNRYNIDSPNREWIDMRNDLIHEGKLSVTTFANKSKQQCIEVVCEVFDWIDQYLAGILNLPQRPSSRFDSTDLRGMNSYTTWD
ncbi:MAG: hypothetical protein WB554_17185 [Desulfomonilaceae bacterium]